MLNDLSSEYWNNRYIKDDFKWDIGSVSTPIKEYILQLNNKEALILIPGAGNAYEAQFLYELGFINTDVLDFASVPLEAIKQRMPDFPKERLIQKDFFHHKGEYDLIIEQTFFCALHPDLREKYVDQMHALLKPGGKLIGLLFNNKMNMDEPPFGGNENEYRNLFSKRFDIKIMKDCYNSIKPRMGKELFVIMQPKEY
ncbi:MAG: methyltransferase domain-containing protein [Bacteroidota bacterium]